MSPVLIVVAVLGLLIAVAVWQHQQEKKRLAALAQWAEANGWSFAPERIDDPGHPFDLFDRGHSRYSRYHARKSFDGVTPGLGAAEFRLFEYHYAITRRTGKHSSTQHYYYACALVEPGADLGCVTIRDESWGDKLVQAIGFDDIDFEDAEFSRRFVVAARERKEAYDLLDGAMMRYLLGQSGWSIATRGRQLLIACPSRVSPEQLEAVVRCACGFLAQLPRPLVNAERARAGLPPLIEAGNAAASSRVQRS